MGQAVMIATGGRVKVDPLGILAWSNLARSY